MSQGTSFDPQVVLRPRSLDETFDLALAYVRTRLRDFRGLLVLMVVLPLLPALAASLLGASDGVALCSTLVAVACAERAVTVFAGRHLFGNPATVRGALAGVGRRLLFTLTFTVLVTLPLLMMAGPEFDDSAWTVFGVLFAMVWPFVMASHLHLGEVALLEQLGPGQAARRARALTAYRFGRALGMILIGILIRGLFVLGAYAGGVFLFGFLLQFQGVDDNFGMWFSLAGYALSGPYMAMVRFFDYIDARTRREGWDIQVRFNAITQRAREERASRLAA